MRVILKIIVAVIALWLVVYGSSFVAGIIAATLGVSLHWSGTAIAWCERFVQLIAVAGFLYALYLLMRQRKPTIK